VTLTVRVWTPPGEEGALRSSMNLALRNAGKAKFA